MKAHRVLQLDRAIYWPLHILISAVLFGTLFSPPNQGSAISGARVFLLIGGIGLYYSLFLVFNFCREKAPQGGPLVFFLLQWILVFWLMISFGGNYLWLLALPVVGQASRFHWSVVIIVCFSYLGGITWIMQLGPSNWSSVFTSVLSIASSFAFVIVFTLATTRAIHAQNRSEELATQLELANGQLRSAAEQTAALAAANERNRIARDIHDGLGHSLTVIAVQLQIAKTLIDATATPRASEAIRRAEELSRSALDEVRGSVSALRVSTNRSLLTGLTELVRQSAPQASLEVRGVFRLLPDEAEQTIYRTVQEGLTNARKHAHAARVEVVLDYTMSGSVIVSIEDDGCGRTDTELTGFGLSGISERVVQLGGKMRAHNRDNGGFALSVTLPV